MITKEQARGLAKGDKLIMVATSRPGRPKLSMSFWVRVTGKLREWVRTPTRFSLPCEGVKLTDENADHFFLASDSDAALAYEKGFLGKC